MSSYPHDVFGFIPLVSENITSGCLVKKQNSLGVVDDFYTCISGLRWVCEGEISLCRSDKTMI